MKVFITLPFCYKIYEKIYLNDIFFPFHVSHDNILHSMRHVKSVQFPICLIFETSIKLKNLVHCMNLCMNFSRTKMIDWNYSCRIATMNEFMHLVEAVFTKGLKDCFLKLHKTDILNDQFSQNSLPIKNNTIKM